MRAQTVIELGAGHGLAGLAAALLNAENVAITDLEYALPAARTTVDLNVAGLEHSNTDVQIEALDWFKPPSDSRGRWSVILASDVVWLQELVRPFVNTTSRVRRTCARRRRVFQNHSRPRIVRIPDSLLSTVLVQ